MKIHETPLAGLLLIEPDVYRDDRGFFFEIYQAERYRAAGILDEFVQDNLSLSRRGVLRGMHVQRQPATQAKLVCALRGEIFDAVVDLRRGSPTFGRWYATRLSGDEGRQLFVPAGFAHGFYTLSEEAVVAYKCSARYAPDAELTLLWSDPEVGIDWPAGEPLVSPKDGRGLPLSALDLSAVPAYAERAL